MDEWKGWKVESCHRFKLLFVSTNLIYFVLSHMLFWATVAVVILNCSDSIKFVADTPKVEYYFLNTYKILPQIDHRLFKLHTLGWLNSNDLPKKKAQQA